MRVNNADESNSNHTCGRKHSSRLQSRQAYSVCSLSIPLSLYDEIAPENIHHRDIEESRDRAESSAPRCTNDSRQLSKQFNSQLGFTFGFGVGTACG